MQLALNLGMQPVPQYAAIAPPNPPWRRIDGGGPRIDQRPLRSSQRGLSFMRFEYRVKVGGVLAPLSFEV